MAKQLTHEQMGYENPRDYFQGLIAGGNPYAAYLFQWVDYHEELHTYRLKMPHDIRLKNGDEHITCRPNGDSWYCDDGTTVADDKVSHIRLSKSQFYGSDPWEFKPIKNTPLI